MFGMELYALVRRAVLANGLSKRQAARRFGIDRKTVDKMCRHSVPPGYRRSKPPYRPKLAPFTGIVDQILEADREAPRKQRHTAKRIFDRLREEHGFSGGYTTVKDYVRDKRLVMKEAFVPLSHPPGHAQVDFGEAQVVIGGVRRKTALFVMSLPYSDACFVKAYPTETTEAFCDGHVSAFAFFGGVPQSILYDNTKLAVARILGDKRRQRTQVFNALVSHYLFADRFGRPGRGNDKGKVENLVGFARRNFLVPIPHMASFAELNRRLKELCIVRQQDQLRGRETTIGERLAADRRAFLDLPAGSFECCDRRAGQVTSQALVRYRSNDYSVPTRYAHRQVLVKGFVDDVVISSGTEEIARHRRSYEREDVIFDPLHYLALLETKPGALDQAAPLQGWKLPEAFAQFRRLAEARIGVGGKREFIQVLRLLETFKVDQVEAGIREALSLRAISYDAVKQLTLCRIERRPARLDLELYPHLPSANVATTRAGAYLALTTQGALP